MEPQTQASIGKRFAGACALPLLIAATWAELLAGQALWLDHVGRAGAMHAACVVFATTGVLALLFPASRADARNVALVSIALAGCLPGTGLLGLFAVALPSWLRGDGTHHLKMIERPMPTFSSEHLDGLKAIDDAAIDPLSHACDVEARVAAVKALRNMEATRAIPLLRRALGDPAEDVRLLAHAILDRRERNVRAKLEESLTLLHEADAAPRPSDARRRAHVELASHYWELAYAGFVSGDGARAVLERAAEHAIRASAHPGERVALLIAIRAFLRLRQLTNAERALSRAHDAEVPAALLAPLRAELAFMQGRYAEVDDALSSLTPLSAQKPYVAQVTRFWADRGDL